MVKLNPDRIEKKSYTLEKKNPKHTLIWEWEEGPELREFIKINKEAVVTIFLGLSAFIKKSIGLKKIPPPIPTTPETKPKKAPIGIEIKIEILL